MDVNNEWNQGFSSDFLPLPQPQESGNSGHFQFAYNNQQDFASQQGFANIPPSGNQQFGYQMGTGGQQGQQFGNQQSFGGQQFGSYPNFDEMGSFESQQGIDGQQQQFGSQPESGARSYGYQNQPTFPLANQTPGLQQQNLGQQPQQGQQVVAPRPRWKNPQQGQSSFGQDQVPFPNNGHLGQ